MCVCTFSSLLIRFISRQQKSHILSSAHNFMQPLATLARHNFRKHGWKEKCKWHEAHWIVRAHIHCKRRTSKETRTAIARPVTASNSKDDNLWTFSGRNHIIQNYLLASVAADPPDTKRYPLPTDAADGVVDDEDGDGDGGRQTTRPANFCQIK